MKIRTAGMAAFSALMLTVSSNVFAAKDAGVSGNLLGPNLIISEQANSEALSGDGSIYYGDSVWFDVVVDGRLNHNRERIYSTTVCVNAAGDVVYQASDWGDTVQFDLWDLNGQGLEWTGEAADCSAMLIHRVSGSGKKGDTITILDQVPFAVESVD